MHWTDDYVGLKYIEGSQDCADLVMRVNREVFARDVPIPSIRETNIFKQTVQINDELKDRFEKIDDIDARDGDVILMICRGRLSHTGVYARIKNVDYVLHNLKSHGGVILQRLDTLRNAGLKLEGFYRLN